MSVNLERHADTLVAAKRSDDRARLVHESRVLSRLHHPGVIEHIKLLDTEPPALLTAWAGTDTWARRTPSTASEACEALAALAATLTDLHDAGVSHRELSPEHVIIANDGRPILCGLGGSGPASPEGIANDTEGLKGLVEHLRSSMDDSRSGVLTDLFDQLNDPTTNLVDFIRLASTSGGSATTPTVGPNRQRPTLVASATAVLILIFVLTVGLRIGGAGDSSAIVHSTNARPDLPSVSVLVPSTTTTISTVDGLHALGETPANAAPTTTIHGEPSTAIGLIEHGGRRYGLGSTGDVVVQGDWNCNGEDTPAILQISSGRVAVFDAWPAPNRQQIPAFTSTPLDAESLMADHVNGCDILRAIGPYGSTIIGIHP